jgi:hypothetical protein
MSDRRGAMACQNKWRPARREQEGTRVILNVLSEREEPS